MAIDGLRHLTFMCELYKDQIDGTSFFLHEHPAQAKSWDLRMFHEILEMCGVAKVMVDQCTLGLWCTDEKRPVLSANQQVRKYPGGHRRCRTPAEGMTDRHKIRSTTCERYPIRLVNALLQALRQDVSARYQLSATEARQHVDEPDVWLTNTEYSEEVYDTITSAELDPSLVATARNAEMTFLVNQLNAYKYDTVENSLKNNKETSQSL